MSSNKKYNIIVAAGGTGGHLFPAIAVVQQIEKLTGDNLKAVFLGDANRIESTKIPALGYEFHSIPISGLKSLLSMNNLSLPIKIVKSVHIARKLIRQFKPDLALCTGAYISYPLGIAAAKENIPLVLMESNVNPGKTIKTLANKADFIFTSFKETENFLNKTNIEKIKYLGNPVRADIISLPEQKKARVSFGLSPDIDTVFVFGGSLGALKINNAMENVLKRFKKENIQFLWQTGNNYQTVSKQPNAIINKFIDDMASAYAAADLVVARSGAATLAELAVCSKPAVLIPLPSASNNEQQHNANIFKNNNAAIILNNEDVVSKLTEVIEILISDKNKLNDMSIAAGSLAKPRAAIDSAQAILDFIDGKN